MAGVIVTILIWNAALRVLVERVERLQLHLQDRVFAGQWNLHRDVGLESTVSWSSTLLLKRKFLLCCFHAKRQRFA